MKHRAFWFIGLFVVVIGIIWIARQTGLEELNVNRSQHPEIWPASAPGPFAVGYMVKHEYDYTRTFKPKVDYFGNPWEGTIARPLQISVWYPAEFPAKPEFLKLKDYYLTMATETDFTPPSAEQLDILIERLKQAWPLEFRVEPERREAVRDRIDVELQKRVFAVRDANPAKGPFPLIIHMPGYNGSPAGHAPLFEYLASRGYVIAAVPNMGMYRRKIDSEAASLDVQARDMEFVAAVMRDFTFVDASHIGTIGMSWGGMSNVLYGQRNYFVDAVLTLDGAITMPEELKLIEAVPGYSHESFTAAYMQLLVAPAEATFRPKDLSFHEALEYSNAHSIQFSRVNHDAFTCGYLRLRNLSEADPERVAYLEAFSRVVYRNTLNFFDAYLKDDTTALQSLRTNADSGDPDGDESMITLREYKIGKQRPLAREEFVHIIRTQGAGEALKIYQDYCTLQPQNNLIVSSVIGPLYMDALEAGDLKEALAICELWETGLPRAPGPLFSKARIYQQTGEKDKAIECYEKILTMVDEGRSAETARSRLNELRSGTE